MFWKEEVKENPIRVVSASNNNLILIEQARNEVEMLATVLNYYNKTTQKFVIKFSTSITIINNDTTIINNQIIMTHDTQLPPYGRYAMIHSVNERALQ